MFTKIMPVVAGHLAQLILHPIHFPKHFFHGSTRVFKRISTRFFLGGRMLLNTYE